MHPHEMPTTGPATITDEMIQASARAVGVPFLGVKAVFLVEAPGGQAFDEKHLIVHRFEPHHFPRARWQDIGFRTKKGEAPYAASLRLPAYARSAMFALACELDREAAYRAASWGAGQIMGAHAKAVGYADATEFVVQQVMHGAPAVMGAFCRLVLAWNLDGPLERQEWETVARVWNGPRRVHIYAPRLEREYERLLAELERPSLNEIETLQRGDFGPKVEALQHALTGAGYRIGVDGDFGPRTQAAVKEFQKAQGLVVDGIVGPRTLAALDALTPA